MLQSVIVQNFKGETLEMELRHPEKTGLLIYNIEGIGGATGSINTSDTATGDGSWYNSARVDTRNITLSLKLMNLPDQSVEESRHVMYRYFPIKKQVRLTFITDRRSMYIDGYVESNETPIFSNQENTQVSVVCPDPMFYALDGSHAAFDTASSLFEFPFCDDSVVFPPPPVYWQDNLIENFDFEDPTKISGDTEFRAGGETIKDWFLDLEMVGNALLTILPNKRGIQIQQYRSNPNDLRWYNVFGHMESGQKYTVSYLDTEVHSETFTFDRVGTASWEHVIPTSIVGATVHLIADAGSEDVRFEVFIPMLTNTAIEFRGVKVEIGDTQTLAEETESGWIIRHKPAPTPSEEELNSPTIEFGTVAMNSRIIIDYDGNSDTGMIIQFAVVGPIKDVTFYDVTTDESFKILSTKLDQLVNGGIQAGDILEVSTYPGRKYLHVLRGIDTQDVTGAMDRKSSWPKISVGPNEFAYDAGDYTTNLNVTIDYKRSYAGV